MEFPFTIYNITSKVGYWHSHYSIFLYGKAYRILQEDLGKFSKANVFAPIFTAQLWTQMQLPEHWTYCIRKIRTFFRSKPCNSTHIFLWVYFHMKQIPKVCHTEIRIRHFFHYLFTFDANRIDRFFKLY